MKLTQPVCSRSSHWGGEPKPARSLTPSPFKDILPWLKMELCKNVDSFHTQKTIQMIEKFKILNYDLWAWSSKVLRSSVWSMFIHNAVIWGILGFSWNTPYLISCSELLCKRESTFTTIFQAEIIYGSGCFDLHAIDPLPMSTRLWGGKQLREVKVCNRWCCIF